MPPQRPVVNKKTAGAKRVRFAKFVTVVEIPRGLTPRAEHAGVQPIPKSRTRRVISAHEMALRLRRPKKTLAQ